MRNCDIGGVRMRTCDNPKTSKCQMPDCEIANMQMCENAKMVECKNATMQNLGMLNCENSTMTKCQNSKMQQCDNTKLNQFENAKIKTTAVIHNECRTVPEEKRTRTTTFYFMGGGFRYPMTAPKFGNFVLSNDWLFLPKTSN